MRYSRNSSAQTLDYYYKKYGSWQYGLDKLYLLMEKHTTVARKVPG